jgi:hypothetical protein
MTIIDPTLEHLARRAPDLDLGVADLDRIAALALRITHLAQERAGIPTEAIHLRPYDERTSQERAAMRAGAHRVIQAMILLGWIELPVLHVPGSAS